jgi:hypothetical protein
MTGASCDLAIHSTQMAEHTLTSANQAHFLPHSIEVYSPQSINLMLSVTQMAECQMI